MLNVTFLMAMIKRCVRRRTRSRRERAERRLYRAATSIVSFVRMVLVRNRTAGDLAGHMAIIHSTRRARRLLMNKQVLKTGFLALRQWFLVWNPSATALQDAVMSWYYSRKFGAFRRGLKQLKGVGLGMLVRMRLRDQMRDLQQELDLNPDNCTREMIQDDMSNLFEHGNKTGRFADVAFHVDVTGRIVRLTAGARCLSGVNAEDDYPVSQGLRLNVNVNMNDSFVDVSMASMASQGMSGSAGFGSPQGRDLNRGTGVLSEASFHSPLKFKQRVFRRTSGQVGGGDVGSTWFVDAPPLELPVPVTTTGMQASMSTVTEGDRRVGLPDYNFSTHAATAAASSSASAVGPEKDSPPPREVAESCASASGASSFPAFVPRTVQELEEYLHLAPNEDVLSILSRRSVHSDPTVHWVPFGILPDAAIARLLCCSLLSITSPSFGPVDAHRIAHVVAASRNRLWANLRALSVYGTRLGDAGILTLLRLPAPALKALSFSNTGCSHHIADFIGKSLVGQESPFEVNLKLLRSISASGHGRNATFQSLVKITFEDEPHLGDRGAVELMQLLQFNGTVRHIVLRRCGLGIRAAAQLSLFLGLSESIKTVNLNGNAMDTAAVLKLMRTMGSMGTANVPCLPLHPLHFHF